ncbi:MAG: GatB/YqeY domain-containing protein [Albidovulum sp.]|nr:GatB/YqeY domain-containing protein [Albidovulum sp.]MDE0533350.1 GatB/YqeY domain-containing protein [Albidovulum sp.]
MQNSFVRARIAEAFQEATASGEQVQLSILRLIRTAIKDKDNVSRSSGQGEFVSDQVILTTLERMIQQREESAQGYVELGRLDSAESERQEIAVIRNLLPKQLRGSEMEKAVEIAIRETGATCVRDKGRVLGTLKKKYPGQLDFREADRLVAKRIC